VVVEISSEEEEDEEEDSSECDAKDMALFMKKFKKYIKKRRSQKETRSSNPQPREDATIVVSIVTSLLIVPLSIGMMIMTRRRTSPTRRTRATREVISPIRRRPMVKLTLGKNRSPMMRAPTLIVPVWQPWLSREHLLQASLSSPSSIKRNILALLRRRTSVR
jgi:hypothetical protein